MGDLWEDPSTKLPYFVLFVFYQFQRLVAQNKRAKSKSRTVIQKCNYVKGNQIANHLGFICLFFDCILFY